MLKLEKLCVKYGQVKGIHNINLQIKRGETVALLGVNGAGKTTTLLAIAGIHRPFTGTITYEGVDITAAPPQERVRMGISLVPEGRRVFSLATVQDNLLMGAHTRQDSAVMRDITRMYGLFPPLAEKKNTPAMSLSGGQQQMLSIARSLMSRPRLLLLDEPTMGLSPKMCNEVYLFIEKSKKDGLTVLVSGEDGKKLTALCDRAVTIVNGILA